MRMKKWAIIANNLEGEDNIYYFESEELARESFEYLCEAYKGYNEYKTVKNKFEEYVSWFDANYNEYSTYVWVELMDIVINDKPIKQWRC